MIDEVHFKTAGIAKLKLHLRSDWVFEVRKIISCKFLADEDVAELCGN